MTTALTVLVWLLVASVAFALLVTVFFVFAFIYAAATK